MILHLLIKCLFIEVYALIQFCENFADFIHGMQTQEVAIKPNLKVVLKPDTEVLDKL